MLEHQVIKASAGTGKTFALTTRILRLLALGVEPERIVALTFSRAAAGEIFDKLVAGEGSAAETAQKEGLLAISDASAIEAWVDQAIAANPQAAADVREGGKKQKKAFGFMMGQVMQLSGGAATPAQVQRLLQAKLGQS